jgi:hypothetical protein
MHWSDPLFTRTASAAAAQIDTAFNETRAALFSAANDIGGAYINYLDEESQAGANKTRSNFGPTYARLVEVKQKYDPERVFGKVSAGCDLKPLDYTD